MPNEIEGAVPFAEDTTRRATTTAIRPSGCAKRWPRCMPVFARFRAGFAGKASPVQFWWGGFDLAVNRLFGPEGAAASGRDAGPARPHHARSL